MASVVMVEAVMIYPGPKRPVANLLRLLDTALRVEGKHPTAAKVSAALAKMLGWPSLDHDEAKIGIESLPDHKLPPLARTARRNQYEQALEPFKLSAEALERVLQVVSPMGSSEIDYLWILDHPKVPDIVRKFGLSALEFANNAAFDQFQQTCFAAINDDPFWDYRQAAWEDDEARFNDWTGYEDSILRLDLTALRLHQNHPMWKILALAFIFCAIDDHHKAPDGWALISQTAFLTHSVHLGNSVMFGEILTKVPEHEMLGLVEIFRQDAGAFLKAARNPMSTDGSSVSFRKTRPWTAIGNEVSLWLPVKQSELSEPWVAIGASGDFHMTTAQEIKDGYFWVAKAPLVKNELPQRLKSGRPLLTYGFRNFQFHGHAEGGSIAFARSDERDTPKEIFAVADIHHRLERIKDDFGDSNEGCYHNVWLENVLHLPMTGARWVIAAAIADDLLTMMGLWERTLMPGSVVNVIVDAGEDIPFSEALQQILEYVLDTSEDGYASEQLSVKADVQVEW